MAAKVKDLTGRKFGKWQVLGRVGKIDDQVAWRCRCECGIVKDIRGGSLRQGTSTSCGFCSEPWSKHGLAGTPIYDVWYRMKKRCENPDDTDYKYYGGRGIKVCKRWEDVTTFASDMTPRPEGGTIERRDVNGDYCPENCCWISQKEQTRNARSNIDLTFHGKTQCLGAWAEELSINYSTLYNRVVTLGWPLERAFSP